MTINLGKINAETFKLALQMRQIRKERMVLVVDDQKFSRDLLKTVIGGKCKLVYCENGEEALASYVANAPDMMFLDIELPGVDGHKVLQLLLKLDPGAFIVMVSANNYPDEINKSIKEGARGFIAKPFNKQKIIEYMEAMLVERNKP